MSEHVVDGVNALEACGTARISTNINCTEENMKLKNILIVVEDIERSKAFYKELFGMDVIRDFGGNVILTGGLVLQERSIWEKFIEEKVNYGGHDGELYFEESDLEGFQTKLDNCSYPIEYVNRLVTHSWGQRVIRIYDPDKHIIEIGEPFQS